MAWRELTITISDPLLDEDGVELVDEAYDEETELTDAFIIYDDNEYINLSDYNEQSFSFL